jgi:hypothetical protein
MNLVTYFYEKLNKTRITSILAFLNNTRCYTTLLSVIREFSCSKKNKLTFLPAHRFLIRTTDTRPIIERAAMIVTRETGDAVVG